MISTNKRNHLIILYIIAVFFYWASLYLYVPTLPVYVESKTGVLSMVGLVLSMYGLWQAILRLPLGILSDWLGKRKLFILLGFALAALGAWVMGAADGVNGLLIGRSITGLAAATWVPLIVAFNSLFPPQEAVRATSILTLVNSLGRMLATSVTGSLNEAGGYSLAFFLAAGVAILAVLAVLPAREMKWTPKKPTLNSLTKLVTRKDVMLPSLLDLVAQYCAWAGTFSFLPILAERLGASDVLLSIMLSTNIAIVVLGNLAATWLLRRVSERTMLYITFTLTAVALAIAAVAGSLVWIFVAQVLMGVSAGAGYPILMGLSIKYVEEHERSTAMGLHQAIYGVGMFAGPWLSGILADRMGIQPMFGVTAFFTFLLGIYGVWMLFAKSKKS